jgi:peptidoglycan/LPS O-acetylase OafA/YrhL
MDTPTPTRPASDARDGDAIERKARAWRARLTRPASPGRSAAVLPGQSRDNAFDGWRLIGAAAVLVGHSFALSGRFEPGIGPNSIGTLGVLGFFGISGFLITQSWLREPRFAAYAGKRALRILPALAFVLLVSALIIGPLVSTLSPVRYFESFGPWKYIATNLVLATHFQLPGVFATNPYPSTVNGSLWTLPHEMHAYVIVAVLGLTGILGRRLLTTVAFTTAVILAVHFPDGVHGLGDSRFFTAFGSGALLYLWRDRVTWSATVAVALLGVAIAMSGTTAANLFMDLALPYVVIYAAYRLPGLGRQVTKHGDFSYGIYLWAFPCQQLLAHLWPNVTPGLMILLVTPPVVVMAAASWHLIEKPALRLKGRLQAPGAEPLVGVASG